MSSILGPRPDDRPPQHEEWSTGVTISIAAHLALIGALWWGLHWHSSTEEVASTAELWSAVPEAAAPPPPPQPKLDAKALQKLHDENLKRMMGQMDAPTTATGTAARNAGPSANWAGKVAALINSHLVYTGSMSGLRPPDIRIRVATDGTILSESITSKSGNSAYDDAVVNAVIATQKLPRDTDGSLPSDVVLTFKP